MEALLHSISHEVATAIQVVAIALVAVGSVRALLNAGRLLGRGPNRTESEFQRVWMNHARWLVAALTFLLAADIVETAFSPTWEELGRLATVAAVRTFLSYFLDRELERAEGAAKAASV